MSTTLACTAIGLDYDPVVEAAQHDIRIRIDSRAHDLGEYCEKTRTITVRDGRFAYLRSTATYQLAHALLEQPTLHDVVEFAARRLIDEDDLGALASATSDRLTWATVLRIRPCLLSAHLAARAGLPLAA